MFPNAFHLFSVNAPESVSKVNTLRHWVGRWGTRRGWRLVFVLLLSLKSAKKGLLTPPLILHAPCQKWLVNMHACLWIAFTSGPVRCECHSWDPAQWFPRTHVHENELLHWYFLVFNVHMCPTPQKSKSSSYWMFSSYAWSFLQTGYETRGSLLKEILTQKFCDNCNNVFLCLSMK